MLHINNQHYAQVCKGDRADVCPRRPTQPVGRLTRPFRPLEDNLNSSGATNLVLNILCLILKVLSKLIFATILFWSTCYSATSCSCQNIKKDHHQVILNKIKIFRKMSQHTQQKFLPFRKRREGCLPTGWEPLSAEILYKYKMACAAKVKERDHSQSINFEE